MRLQTLFGRIPSFQRFAIACIALVSLIALSSSAAESEPNDQLGQASPLPASGSTTETFGAAGDLDWFRITVSEPGRLIVSVVSPPPNVRAEIVMYGRNTELLPIYKNAVNNGDDVHVIFDVIIPGTYFARLRELEGDISAGSYLLTTTFQPVVDSHETNDRIGKASLMNGSPMTGTLFPKGDIDWYRIYADVGTRLALELRGSVEMQGELSLYDPDMNWMGVYSLPLR